MAEIITGVFDELRDGRLTAAGFVPATGGRTCVPVDLWWSAAATLDVRTGGLLVGEATLFCGVEVRSPVPPPRSASRAALDRFVGGFDVAMQAADHAYVIGELVTAARQHLGDGVSAREVEGALKRSSTAARAGGGRRPAALVPSQAELADAGRLAAGTTS